MLMYQGNDEGVLGWGGAQKLIMLFGDGCLASNPSKSYIAKPFRNKIITIA